MTGRCGWSLSPNSWYNLSTGFSGTACGLNLGSILCTKTKGEIIRTSPVVSAVFYQHNINININTVIMSRKLLKLTVNACVVL